MRKISVLKKISSGIYGELCIIFFISTTFLTSAALSSLPLKTNFTALVFNTGLSAAALCTCFLNYCRHRQKEGIEAPALFRRIRNKKEILILFLFVLFTRFWQFGMTPRWDSESYLQAIMNACRTFDFTLTSYLQSFHLCEHTSLGYSVFLAIGEYWNPDGVYGINSINFLLLLFFTYFLYEIISYAIPGVSKMSAALGTMLILAEPLACGTFGSINIDFPIMIFSIFMVFMHIRKYYILFFFFAVVLIQSKEVGLIITIGYTITYMLLLILDEYQKAENKGGGNKRRVGIWQGIWKNRKIGFTFGMLLCQLFYLLAIKSGRAANWSGGVQFGVTEENASNYFALVPDYVLLKLKMIFIMNFYWLFSAILAVGILAACFCFFKKHFISKEKSKIAGIEKYIPLISLYAGLGALLIFNCFYITWSNPRYHYVLEMGLFLGTVLLLLTAVKNSRVQQILFIVLTIICLLESYTTVDIVTANIFECRDTGGPLPVVHPAWNAKHNQYLPMDILKDMAMYNNQLSYLDKAYDKILDEADYNEEMDIVIWDKAQKYNGFSTSSMNRYWNPEKRKRTFAEKETTVLIHMVYPDNIEKLMEAKELRKEAVYIHTESYGVEENTALKQLEKYYDIVEKKTVKIFMQGAVNYYRLRLKV